MINRNLLLDLIEDIQDRANTNNIGSNEAELDTREYVADLLESELKNIYLVFVSERKELLISSLYGWKDYKDQGISIEDYVDEIESNL
jgi:hypothetical protein